MIFEFFCVVGVFSCSYDGDVYVFLYEFDDMVYYFVVFVDVVFVGINCFVGVECDKLKFFGD